MSRAPASTPRHAVAIAGRLAPATRLVGARVAIAAALLLCAHAARGEIRYELDVSARQSPPIATPVSMEIDDAPSPLVLVFSNWLPGAYELRWFGRDVTELAAIAERPLAVERVGPDRFVIRGHAAHAHVHVQYRVTAALLSDDGAEVSAAHVYFNPAAVLPRALGLEDVPHRLGLHGLPPAWRRVCSLGGEAPYAAQSWSSLADALFEAAPPETLAVATMKVENARFTIAVDRELAHEARIDPQLESDVAQLVRAEVGLAGPFPQPRYLVLIHETDRPGHSVGLEHAQATSIIVPATSTDEGEARSELRHMLAHEIFHVWNARRIVPAELVAWDPERPQASRDLWISEGLTEYASIVARVRAGMLDASATADALSGLLTRTRRAAVGLSLESLSQLAFAAPHALLADEDAYYAVGASVSLALVAELERRSHGHRGLFDVLHAILPPPDAPPSAIDRVRLGRALESLAPKTGLDALVDRLVTQPLSFAAITAPLRAAHLSWSTSPPLLDLGAYFGEDSLTIEAVEPGGAFSRAGLLAGDRMVTIDGVPATRSLLEQLVHAPRRALIGAMRTTIPVRVWVEPGSLLGAIEVDAASIDVRSRLLHGPR